MRTFQTVAEHSIYHQSCRSFSKTSETTGPSGSLFQNKELTLKYSECSYFFLLDMVKFFNLGFCLNNHTYHSNKIISILYIYDSFYMPGILLLRSGHNQVRSYYYTHVIDGELEVVWDHVIAQGHSWYVVQPELKSYKWFVISLKHMKPLGLVSCVQI